MTGPGTGRNGRGVDRTSESVDRGVTVSPARDYAYSTSVRLADASVGNPFTVSATRDHYSGVTKGWGRKGQLPRAQQARAQKHPRQMIL